jgi:hypothetical protein
MRTLLAFASLSLAACSQPAPPPPEPPAPIHHVILFTLKDASEAAALIRDCDAVGELPGARGASAGTWFDTGRVEAANDWHVAFHVAFADAAAYKAWREHPHHRGAIAKWEPRIASVAVHDWTDPTP